MQMKEKNSYIFWIVSLIAVSLISLGVKVEWPTQLNAADYWTDSSQQTRSDLSATPKIDVSALNQAFVTLAEKLSPAVVNVYTKTKVEIPHLYGPGGAPDEFFFYFFGNPLGDRLMIPPMEQEAQSLGSGFIINDKGHIITNSHVVRHAGKNADEIMVKFLKEDRGKGFPAEVVGVDERTDVALLKLKKPHANLTVAPLGDSDKAKVGEWVVAIGNPYGHAHTVTQGIVSALGRNLENLQAEFIQTSASINPGNSGGPLINLYGEVIGINTAIDPRAQGIGFAIPINSAKKVIKDLIEEGRVKRGFVGIMISGLSPEISDALGMEESQGVLVRDVVKNGPAEKAGIKKGDIINKVGTETITGPEKLIQVISSKKAGEKVPFELLRKGKKLSVTVKVEEEKSEETKQMQSKLNQPFDLEG